MTEHSRSTGASPFISEVKTLQHWVSDSLLDFLEIISELPIHSTQCCTQQNV